MAAAASSGAARAQEELPVIGLNIAPAVIAENAGQQAGIGTARRDFGDKSRPLTIRLNNALPGTLTVPSSVTIPSGEELVTFPVSVTDDQELNGTRTALITASADGFFDTYFAASITDDESAFAITVSPERIAENGGRATVTISRAVSSAGVAEEVLLSASGDGAVELPEKVSFAAGQAAATFEVVARDNNAFDGERTITLTASRSRSSQSTTADLILIDNELDLTLDVPATFAESAPAGLFATVSRTTAAAEQGAIAVSVASSDPSEILASQGVVMAQGQTSVRVPLQAIDDRLVDGAQGVTLTASATGYNPDSKTVSVTDDDRADLQLSLNTSAASESGEPAAAWGTLRRNTPTTAPVTVALRAGSPRVSVPPSVTIARGAVEVRFPIRVLDNTARDGNVNVTITASAAGFPTRSAVLGVFDNDGPSLQIALTPPQVLEGSSEAARGTVTRLNTPLTQALAVALTSSDKTVALLAGSATLTVTIPAGQSSASFVLSTPDDAVPTDLRSSTISATASGLNRAAVAVDVRDNDDRAELRLTLQALIPSRDTVKLIQDPDFSGPAVDEDAGPLAIRATVTRNTATTSEVIVQLNTQGDIVVPRFVVIPFGQSSVSFNVTPIDDDRNCDQDADVISSITPEVAGYTFVPVFLDGSTTDTTNQVLVADNDSIEGCVRVRRVKVIITPRVQRDPAAIAEIDGPNAATITVKRADASSVDDPEFSLGLVVDLVSSAPERAAPIPGLATSVLSFNASRSPISPARIILLPGRTVSFQGQLFPAGEFDPEDKFGYLLPYATLPLSIVNDGVRQGCSSITITPVVVGYVNPRDLNTIIPASTVGQGYKLDEIADSVDVLDAQPEVGGLTVSPSIVNESGASGVATGVVRRAPGVTGALTVTVRTLNAAKIGVSPTNRHDPRNTLEVTIPEGQQEASFNIIANDNSINDGDVTALLEAGSKCSVAVVRAPIVVRDDDPGQLSMSITLAAGQKKFIEGMPANGVVGMVQRSGNLKAPVVVSLRSSDTSELVVPATVTIPAGVARVTFTPRVVDDRIKDGTQRVMVTATSPSGAARPTQVTLSVLDNEK